MKKIAVKSLLPLLLSVGLMAGCATQPEEPQGPTQEELEAQRAREAAEAAARENEACLQEARRLAEQVNAYTNLNADQSARLDAARAAMRNNEGCRARDLLSALASELEAARMTYTVVRGDNLWSISGKSEVYGNPYQWPLIYKENRDKIQDADLIFPGQEFEINKNPSASDVDAAVQHARTRGAWTLGETEDSDRDYLSR
ncbi:MAG TPA: LysM peptidoglycan-binding domain-containing protein [Gammaproteobacteria bacterium]|nr:LysM peptidoglycan-binding domain-containing protein [Gammaproteobacteria bacterium]